MGTIDYIPRIYLVDTENIGRVALDGLLRLRENDRAIIFESDYTFKISFEEMLSLDCSKISVIKAHNSLKNAMDFMITTTLGHLVSKNKNAAYIVVSKDTGFDEVVKFWRQQGICVRRHEEIGISDCTIEAQTTRTKELLLKELNNIYELDITFIHENEEILKRIINFRVNENCYEIARAIYYTNYYNECIDEIYRNLKYSRDAKVNIIIDNWKNFFHCN